MTERLHFHFSERSEREGIYVYTELIHFIVQQKLAPRCKVIILQLKKKHNLMSSGWQKADLKACLLRALVHVQGLKSISLSAGDLLRFTVLITRALKTS